MAGLLAYFRELQRQLDLSVILVHHTRKNAAGGVAAGQGLRGSSDLHAFGDSNLYLCRLQQHLVLLSEHRAAPASPPVSLQLVASPAEMTHLEVVAQRHEESFTTLADQVLALLPDGRAVTRTKLRDTLSVQNQRLGHVLESLAKEGRIRHTPAGWQRLS